MNSSEVERRSATEHERSGGMSAAGGRSPRRLHALRTLARRIIDAILKFRRHYIWEASLDGARKPSVWGDEERFHVIEPESLEKVLNPRLLEFLGGDQAADDLKGVRQGDRLLLVSKRNEYAFSGYIYFDTTAATRRQKKIFIEGCGTPVIGTCYTAEAWRGRNIYRRVLNDTFRYLHQNGFSRAVADVNSHNHASNKASAAAGMNICRELTDWTIFGHLVIQHVKHGDVVRWRVVIV